MRDRLERQARAAMSEGHPLTDGFDLVLELDMFLEALERSVTGELLEAGDTDSRGDPAQDRAASQAVAANVVPSNPARSVHRWTVGAIESAQPTR